MNKKKESRWRNINVGWLAIIVLLVGIIILFCLQTYENSQYIEESATVSAPIDVEKNFTSNEVKPSLYITVVKPILSNLAITMIVLGIGSLLFEVYGYVSYFRKRISEVFTDYEMVELLNKDYKKQLKFNVTKSLFKPNTEDSEKILNLFDDELDNILNSYYYSDYNLHVEVKILDNKFIEKKIIRTIEIKEINSDSKNMYEKILSVSCKPLKDADAFKLSHIKINDITLQEEKDYKKDASEVQLEHYPENFSYVLLNPQEITDEFIIECEYTTIVPLDDRSYSVRVDKLCHNFNCEFVFNSEEMEVGATGFKFSPTQQNAFKYKKYNTTTKAYTKEWLLPGEGVVFTIFTK